VHSEIDNVKEDGTEKDTLSITLEFEAMLKVHAMTKMNEAQVKIILYLEDGQLSHCL
jgi:hypothetical protein